jgi:hypothetical protein
MRSAAVRLYAHYRTIGKLLLVVGTGKSDRPSRRRLFITAYPPRALFGGDSFFRQNVSIDGDRHKRFLRVVIWLTVSKLWHAGAADIGIV